MSIHWRLGRVCFSSGCVSLGGALFPPTTVGCLCCDVVPTLLLWMEEHKGPRLNPGPRAFASPPGWYDASPSPGDWVCWGSTSGQPLSGAAANHVFMCQGAPWRWGHCCRSRSGGGRGLLFFLFFNAWEETGEAWVRGEER